MSDPLWERLLVAAAGPVVAALLGSLLVGLYLATRASKEADRREEADNRRQFEFRQTLVEAMVRASVPLEMACKTYPGRLRRIGKSRAQRVEATRELDRLYLSFRTDSAVVMRRLQAHYAAPELRQHWHAIEDLLTVRYYQLRGLASPRLLEINAGEQHSGLTADQLTKPGRVYGAIEAGLERTTQLVLKEDLTLPA